MKLDLRTKLKTLEGKDFPNNEANKILAAALMGSPDNSVKFYGWGIKLFSEGAIEIDNADRTMLEAFVKANKFLTNLVKGPILEKLEAVKDK